MQPDIIKNNINILYNKLIEKPYSFSINQAISILEKHHTECKNFGYGNTSTEEPIKLSNYIQLSVPKSDCIKIDLQHKLFIVNATGLLGMNGIFPRVYTEQAFLSLKNKKYLFIDFINIFQHRYLALSYKLEKKYEHTLKSNYKFESTFMINGLNNHKLQYYLTPFLSLFLNKNKTSQDLQSIIKCIIHTDVKIHEFQEKWYNIPKENQLTLNREALKDKAIGFKSQNIQSAIKIELSFQNYNEYIKYLNNPIKKELLNTIVKYYLNNTLSFKIIYSIKTFTTKTFKADYRNKLGITTWL